MKKFWNNLKERMKGKWWQLICLTIMLILFILLAVGGCSGCSK